MYEMYFRSPSKLFAEFEFLDDFLISFAVLDVEVVEQFLSFADHSQQSKPGMIVFHIRLKMGRKLNDARSQNSDLHFRQSGIFFRLPVFGDDFLFLFLCDWHSFLLKGLMLIHLRKILHRLIPVMLQLGDQFLAG